MTPKSESIFGKDRGQSKSATASFTRPNGRGAVGLLPRCNSGGAVTALPLFVHPQARIGTAYRAGALVGLAP